MKKSDRDALRIFSVLILICFLFAFAVSQGSALIFGIPLFAVLVGITFVVQWLVFIPAFFLQSEKFFDLTGSITYILIVSLALFLRTDFDLRSVILWLLVIVWAVRLGVFLFVRIHKAGKDDRFDELKPSFFRFLNVWTIQGLWVTFTGAAALAAMTSNSVKEIGFWEIIGILFWVIGFAIENLADIQKSSFNKNVDNKGKFIQTGLWARSRHPNYFGEILLWTGIALVAVPVLQGFQLIALISPVFVTLLLTRVSGIPLLEKKAEKKWGGQDDYEDYKKKTPLLVPKLF